MVQLFLRFAEFFEGKRMLFRFRVGDCIISREHIDCYRGGGRKMGCALSAQLTAITSTTTTVALPRSILSLLAPFWLKNLFRTTNFNSSLMDRMSEDFPSPPLRFSPHSSTSRSKSLTLSSNFSTSNHFNYNEHLRSPLSSRSNTYQTSPMGSQNDYNVVRHPFIPVILY